MPSSFDIMEAVLPENVSTSFYTKSDKLIVSDGRNLVYFPTSDDELRSKFAELNVRRLDANGTDSIEDIKIIRRLVERAISMSIQNITEQRMRHGIYLLEDPISLYRCERVKLYLGFSVDVRIDRHQQHRQQQQLAIELSPHAYVRESVLDYIKLRRERGASANAVIRMLLNYRSKIIVAPTGHYGSIVEVISKKASNQLVSEHDNRNLVDFWKEVYDIDISPDEIPLLKIKMLNSENTFTYPASMCFFGSESLYVPASVQKFIGYKESRIIPRMYDVVKKAIKDLKIGDNIAMQQISEIRRANDRDSMQRQILEDTRRQIEYVFTDSKHTDPLQRVVPAKLISSEYYDREKYLEMLLESAEAVLAVFGFSRSLYGFDSRKKSYRWWNELYEQRQRDIELAKPDL
jgi:hypothetical protein